LDTSNPYSTSLISRFASSLTLRGTLVLAFLLFGFGLGLISLLVNCQAPEYKQNLGEIYNFSVARGTLTDEDRYINNEHIINTIKMLETLPLPPDLKNVPDYAGGHHETLDGRGYPRNLTAEQLSIPARIVAIADIFEALTASDRPYKSGKPISAALSIMKKMRDNSHIDSDLFALFLRSGVYKKYAEEFLDSNLIDDVDIESYLV
jgi:HD-GYP domain-containing protein (c-di-GMP phosphodiesterase class II)